MLYILRVNWQSTQYTESKQVGLQQIVLLCCVRTVECVLGVVTSINTNHNHSLATACCRHYELLVTRMSPSRPSAIVKDALVTSTRATTVSLVTYCGLTLAGWHNRQTRAGWLQLSAGLLHGLARLGGRSLSSEAINIIKQSPAVHAVLWSKARVLNSYPTCPSILLRHHVTCDSLIDRKIVRNDSSKTLRPFGSR